MQRGVKRGGKRGTGRSVAENGTPHGRTAETRLLPFRFRGGEKAGRARLSPRLSPASRHRLRTWLESLPAAIAVRLPPLRIAAAGRLRTEQGHAAHACCFIPQRYLLLEEALFSRPGELGRILCHELCHFLWPRLRAGRAVYESALLREYRSGSRGDLGYASALARSRLLAGSAGRRDARWRHYACESFCDTGAFLLLRAAGYRRTRHSEWTLARRRRPARLAAWHAAVTAGA